LYAQEEIGNGYLFPEFEKGIVSFKNGAQSSALLNYSMFQEEMIFLDKDSTVMALAEPANVIAVVIGERRFIPISSKGVFYEEIKAGDSFFYAQQKATLLSEGKAAGYGGYSQTSSVNAYVNLYDNLSGGMYKLNVSEKFRLRIEKFLFLKSGNSYKRFNSAKSLGKLFKGNEKKIEDFSHEQAINFSKIEDIARIVEYCYSLPKK